MIGKSPVLSFCVDSCTHAQPSHRVILSNAYFQMNVMGDIWRSILSDFRAGPIWSGPVRVLTTACRNVHYFVTGGVINF